MSLDQFSKMYLDWLNNYLTIERFAEDYDITVKAAKEIIELGRAIGNLQV